MKLSKEEERDKLAISRRTQADTMGQPSSRYTIIDELRQEGMGVVYKVKDTLLDGYVAYKTLPSTLKDESTGFRQPS